MRDVRAHSNYLSDAVRQMWCDLFDLRTVFNNKIHTVGIFDECAVTKAMHNTFDEQTTQSLYQSARRLRISLVFKQHA